MELHGSCHCGKTSFDVISQTPVPVSDKYTSSGPWYRTKSSFINASTSPVYALLLVINALKIDLFMISIANAIN
jgi:hypothetical protein